MPTHGARARMLFCPPFLACSMKPYSAAPGHAARRAKEPFEARDVEGRAVWLRIGKAIKELLFEERPSDEKVH